MPLITKYDLLKHQMPVIAIIASLLYCNEGDAQVFCSRLQAEFAQHKIAESVIAAYIENHPNVRNPVELAQIIAIDHPEWADCNRPKRDGRAIRSGKKRRPIVENLRKAAREKQEGLERCRHGLIQEQCTVCRDNNADILRHPLTLFLLKPGIGEATETRPIFGLVLWKVSGSTLVKVFVDDPQQCCQEMDNSWIDEIVAARLSHPERKGILLSLRERALKNGLLFVPKEALTEREKGPDGPSHCAHCDRTLSFAKGSLGCTQCHCYVCPDGVCMCGFPGGRNYLQQFIPPQPELRCDAELRRICVGIVTRISSGGCLLVPRSISNLT
jgi:hypothetical protein